MGITDVVKNLALFFLAAGPLPLGALLGYLFPGMVFLWLGVGLAYGLMVAGVVFWMQKKEEDKWYGDD